MAPLIKTALQLLLGSLYPKDPKPGTMFPDSRVNEHIFAYGKGGYPSLSAVSWGRDRLDVFGIDNSIGSLSHNWWDGNQWKPSVLDMELPRGTLRWSPDGLIEAALSITSGAPGWLDIFAKGSFREEEDITRHLRHKYYNGSDWSGWIDLQGYLQSSPIAISPYLNVLEVRAVLVNFSADDLYIDRIKVFALGDDEVARLENNVWDGSKWSGWERTATDIITSDSDSTLTSSGGGRLDIFAVDPESTLFHAHYDFGEVQEEDIGGFEARGFSGKPAVIGGQGEEDSPPKRIDVVVLGKDSQYYHVFGNGIEKWGNWTCHGGQFSSAPAIVSWGNDAAQPLDIFGITTDGQLAHQAWQADNWYPALYKWEIIGGNLKAF